MAKPTPADVGADDPNAKRRAEIALELEWLDVEARYLAAKASLPRDDPEFIAAKQAMSEMRTYWRQIGEACGTRRPVNSIGA